MTLSASAEGVFSFARIAGAGRKGRVAKIGSEGYCGENVHICGKAMEGKNGVDLAEKMLHVEHFCGTAIPSI